MLEYPLGVQMDPRVLANDLSFYDGITSQTGPAMTWSMFAIGWFNVGNFTASQGHFRHGYANVQAPFRVWTETPQGGAVNFITGAGGFLQSVLFGTSGMRLGKAASRSPAATERDGHERHAAGRAFCPLPRLARAPRGDDRDTDFRAARGGQGRGGRGDHVGQVGQGPRPQLRWRQ